jgi:hypothetical protein
LNALANLPRTLDETYERIFLGIPEDDRLFVHHVLKWIYYYNDGRTVYYRGNFPCSILLHATERSTSHLSNGRQDFLYDEEALRELCGCLIVITSEVLFDDIVRAAPTVTFAHYTVLEFLQSTRIFNSPVAFFGIEKESTVVDFTRITLIEVLDADSNILGGKQYYGNRDAFAHFVAQDFNSYCAASAMLSINSWTTHLNNQDDLVTLVFEMVNPSKPHFESLRNSLDAMETSLVVFSENSVECDDQFWTTRWVVPPANINSAILLGLGGMDTFDFFSSKLMDKVNIEVLFEEEVVLFTRLDSNTERWYRIKGPIVDAIAQLSGHVSNFDTLFDSLLDSGERRLNASTLLSYIGSHGEQCSAHSDCGKTCCLIKLLQLGAQPDAPGYRVKPLQIAVVCWDFEGVEILLQAGADPNDCGYENGIVWEDNDLLGQFNNLGGCSPLFICKEFDCIREAYSMDTRSEADRNRIEELLVADGARSFKEDWACGVTSEEEELGSEREWGSSESDANDREGSVEEYEEN